MPKDAIFQRNDGTSNVPGVESPWDAWVSASRTRNWCRDDPLLDWLDRFGEHRDFVRDDRADGHDPRTDFLAFVFAKGQAFEAAVLGHLSSRHHVVRIASSPAEVRDSAAAIRTWDAMCAGAEMVSQAVLWNPETQTYGAADLLVRSDILARLFPSALSADEVATAAPDLPSARLHYRVVDIKFTTLDLLKSGHAASGHREYMAQVWLYNEALGRIQGVTPPSAYILGRGWKQGEERGRSALERLARVDREYVLGKKDIPLRELALAACAWVRRVRADGANWVTLPAPTVEELRPNMRHTEDAPWHRAKQQIATSLEDLTLPRPARERSSSRAGPSATTPLCASARSGATSSSPATRASGGDAFLRAAIGTREFRELHLDDL